MTALRNNIIAGLKDESWSVKDDLIFIVGKIFTPSNTELLDDRKCFGIF
jgi:hypothetical protein